MYYIPVTTETKGNNSDPEVVAKVKTLTGFFFGGGDQARIIYSFYNEEEHVPSPVLTAIKQTLSAVGGVVAGTSAGTDCQTASIMIEGGSSYSGLRDGSAVFWKPVHPIDEDVLAAYGSGGIGLFPSGLLDTHFSNRGRQGRLVQLLSDTSSLPTGHNRAFGIDENTALVVTGPWGHRVGTVIGERGVVVFDVASAVLSSGDIQGVWSARLSEGDVIDLATLSVTFAAFKKSMAGREADIEPESSHDIFRDDAFEVDRIAKSLFESTARSTSGHTAQSNPRFVVDLNKEWKGADGSVVLTAVAADGVNPATGIYAFSYSGIQLDFIRQEA